MKGNEVILDNYIIIGTDFDNIMALYNCPVPCVNSSSSSQALVLLLGPNLPSELVGLVPMRTQSVLEASHEPFNCFEIKFKLFCLKQKKEKIFILDEAPGRFQINKYHWSILHKSTLSHSKLYKACVMATTIRR